MGYEPTGTIENAGAALGMFTAHVENTMKDFKHYIEERQVADGAWRGEVHGGRREPGASDRRPTETPPRTGQ